LERGYNCLTFEGPGQGGVIRKQNIPFRYDWEKVVTPVLDYAFSREKIVDPNRIALMGISMGGYLAARAAAFEDRIAFYTTESMMVMTHLLQGFLNHYEMLLKMVMQMSSIQLLIFYQTPMQI
jgi:alpha-beta hydrolase superfamily lysophospholipase